MMDAKTYSQLSKWIQPSSGWNAENQWATFQIQDTQLTSATIRLNCSYKIAEANTLNLQFRYIGHTPQDYATKWTKYEWESNGTGTALLIGAYTSNNYRYGVQLRANPASGTNPAFYNQRSIHYYFSISGANTAGGSKTPLIYVQGNFMTLFNSNNPPQAMPAHGFTHLFAATKYIQVYQNILPAKILGEYCYEYMFINTPISRCPGIQAAVPASGCYQFMFEGCSGITSARIGMEALMERDALRGMFKKCTGLKYLELNYRKHDPSKAENWLSDVAPTGTLVVPNDADFSSFERDSSSGVPQGWTLQTTGGRTIE